MKFLKLKAKQSVEGLDDVLIWMPRGEKYEEFMESPITKKSFVAANTNGVVEYMRYTDKLSPFNKGNFNFIKNTVANGIKEDLNGSDIDAINEMVMNYFTKQLDFFKFNEKQTKAWIYEYPKRFSKIVENDPYLKNVNEFTKRLSVQTLPQRTLNGRERLQIIKYSGSRFDNEVAKDFMAYIMSTEGQEIVSNEKYIPVSDVEAYAGSKPSGKCVVGGSSSVSPLMEKLIEAYKKVNPNADIELQTSDSTTGMTSTIEGSYDIGMASRELKDDEASELEATVIATDGIAVIVNKANTADELSADQVKSIYVGDVTTWDEVSK